MLTEVTSKNEEVIDFNHDTIADLIKQLNQLYPELRNKDFKVAVNQEIADINDKLQDGEVALLPPFSGG